MQGIRLHPGRDKRWEARHHIHTHLQFSVDKASAGKFWDMRGNRTTPKEPKWTQNVHETWTCDAPMLPTAPLCYPAYIVHTSLRIHEIYYLK